VPTSTGTTRPRACAARAAHTPVRVRSRPLREPREVRVRFSVNASRPSWASRTCN
jgi:hypothetical protein